MSTRSPGSGIGNWPRSGSIHHDTLSVGLNKTVGMRIRVHVLLSLLPHAPRVARGKQERL